MVVQLVLALAAAVVRVACRLRKELLVLLLQDLVQLVHVLLQEIFIELVRTNDLLERLTDSRTARVEFQG